VIERLWGELDAAFRQELAESNASVQDFLRRRNPAWNLVGRVHFNLAENRKDADAPFAFLATYTARLSAHAKAQHLPLGRALREYSGAANRSRLLSLPLHVQRAAESCPWLKSMVDANEIFHPLRWTPEEAFRLLTDLSRLEAAGVVVRVPVGWRAGVERYRRGIARLSRAGHSWRAGQERARASRIARQTRSGVTGMSRWRTPSGASASLTAFSSAGRAPTVPASPTPLAPSGLTLVGTSWWPTSKGGMSSARGIA
jgi:hypothetical protein